MRGKEEDEGEGFGNEYIDNNGEYVLLIDEEEEEDKDDEGVDRGGLPQSNLQSTLPPPPPLLLELNEADRMSQGKYKEPYYPGLPWSSMLLIWKMRLI